MNSLSVLALFLLVWTSFGFLLSRILHRNDIADLLWGSGIALLSLVMAAAQGVGQQETIPASQLLLLILVVCWGLRLTLFLAVRNLPEPEDSRYAAWRLEWGTREPWIALLRVFGLQTCFAVIVALPVYLKWGSSNSDLRGLSLWDLFWFWLAAIGLVIESVADWQLYRFRRQRRLLGDRAPGLLDRGLWRYSRHPNYFGEVTFWWGVTGLGILNLSWAEVGGSLLGCALITFLLLRVSGVPMTERGMARRRGPEYARYLAETSPFVLLPRSWYRRVRSRTQGD